ncbi:TetR/AcrR family transcriptional regulator [Kutzneria sp. CA-103260]|uniref:TetR/AcrR family transcriptional regulator n=1 Tax=Kutzneria sp. CA-103260 TaxID=2802641 RepID=UPI001BAA57F6|nr:TetR/AcrR family transcriptional regulator [Kutzneria sp. CA-103260]QUQ62545.1 TetR family transcriptional regulator [Kutzneria sp. CA-103260]
MKAARILDAAEELLVSYGYRRITVDEVARRAGVGKGTVYLYWPSKLELFGAVLTRDAARLVSDQLAAMRTDPAEVLLHRSLRWAFLAVMARPLARAWATTDLALLGELATQSRSGMLFAGGKRDTTDRFLAVLHKHGLLLDEPDPLLAYRLSAAVTGSFVLGPLTPEFDVEAQADALALTVRRAFEPTETPDPAAAAAEITGLYQDWLSDLRAELP